MDFLRVDNRVDNYKVFLVTKVIITENIEKWILSLLRHKFTENQFPIKIVF